MAKITLLIIFGFLTFFGFSQQNTVATGGNATGTNGSISYSIGQIDYANVQGSNGSVNQGVQQPYEFYVGLNEELSIDLSLFPNPTHEFIILKLENLLEGLSYELFDMNGKLLAQDEIESTETLIDMREFAAGQYHVALSNKNTHQTIKLIKH